MKDLKDRILGCLVGGAVGDALGYPVEFISYEQIISEYGPKGITRYELSDDDVAEISDDTQMTLFTANGLLIDDIKSAYIEWLHTQMYDAPPLEDTKCWLSQIPELYSRRAPGITCMSALDAVERGYEAKNNSKGCGGIMRVAPIALWGAVHNVDIMDSVRMAFDAASMTHKHTLGWLPAGMLVYVIQRIIQDDVQSKEALIDILNDSSVVYEDACTPDNAETLRRFDECTKSAIAFAASDLPDIDAIRQLGEGWVGEEAWYISLYCVLRHFDSFEAAVVAAVNHSGDSDSTGAITGNIMGAIHGYSSIPEYYKTNLELIDVISKMSTALITSNI